MTCFAAVASSAGGCSGLSSSNAINTESENRVPKTENRMPPVAQGKSVFGVRSNCCSAGLQYRTSGIGMDSRNADNS